jgi:SAM-dependent methyltransferase
MAADRTGPVFGDAVAKNFDAGRSLPAGVANELEHRIVAATRVSPGAAVLDVGAGTGVLAKPFLRDGYRYTGIDGSAEMLRQFRAGEAALIQADLRAMPLRDACVDVLLAFRVLGVVRGWRRGIRECLRVLRPGGYLLAGRVSRDPRSLFAFVRDERNRLLREAGIETERPGAGDGELMAALEADATLVGDLEPVEWTLTTTPRRLMEQNLSGWRIAELAETDRRDIWQALSVAVAARVGDLDQAIDESQTVGLSLFRR